MASSVKTGPIQRAKKSKARRNVKIYLRKRKEGRRATGKQRKRK